MCYKKILPPVIPPPKLPAAEVTVTTEVVAIASVRDDGGEKKVCVCSPSKHPRSFKCRYHHHEYQWLPSSSSSSSSSSPSSSSSLQK
ncbi:uncharacterized protein LOC103868510 [Brassica rapa]|uniref:Uncharacterized protein n=1 Tax=Brassica campestris TaxID=3711 RepID=M4ENL9_BRACM|nr:uncharacterized protein LOC103868510 [Brassica rapa]